MEVTAPAPAAAEASAETSSKGKGKGKGPMQSVPFVGAPHPTCPVKIRGYSHTAIAVTDEAEALEFYGKFGFVEKTRRANAVVLTNPNTAESFEVHLLLQPGGGPYAGAFGKDTGTNVLMDIDEKHPGHTHIAFNVPSLPATKEYLQVCTVHLSGERGNAAVFVRDPDRNTVELIGPLVGPHDLKAESVLVSVNHIGIRVRDIETSIKWYGDMLGFGERTFWYEPDRENPKSNGAPWIAFNAAYVEINFILNCTTAAAAEGKGNILLQEPQSSGLCPGILYPGFQVENFEESVQFLKDQGVEVLDDDTAIGTFDLGAERVSPPGGETRSAFLRDIDGNIIRLIG